MPTSTPAAPAIAPDLCDAEQDRLLARLRAGEEQAFDELVRIAAGRMLAVARQMLDREQDAQDAVQEAFLSAFRSLERFDGRSKLTTWLHRIVVNACLMRLRTQRRKPERPISDLLPRFLEDGHQETPCSPWSDAEASGLEQRELRHLVRAKIAELPEAYRVVLVLRDIEGVDTDATAKLLELTPAAVKTRLHRARQALRELLSPHLSA